MSIYKGTTLLAGNPVIVPLFTTVWQDHILNDISWLRADTFSWQSGLVYTAAYQHLVSEISGLTAQTETIGYTTITYYQASDGHKIVLADQETNVLNVYISTGVAWYYVLDTANTQFKLPRRRPTSAEEVYLYMYIGQYSQTAIQQTAGLNSSLFSNKVDISSLSALCMPDYESCIAGGLIGAGTWIQAPKDSQVVVWGTDPYTEDFKALVSPDFGQTQYQVGYRYDDQNGYTEGTSFCFLVPKNWYFTSNVEQGFHYRIYPLRGAN